MIPTNLVDRMKVVSDFDTLILRHTVIEMAVQTFCRPSGAASEILTMFEETFRQDREPLVHSNGHVKRGQPAAGLLEEAEEPARSSKRKNASRAWYEAAAKRKAEDPWKMSEWRQAILRWAAEHNWVFNAEAYRSFYEAQYKRSLSDTRCMGTLSDMLSRQRAVRRTGQGVYTVTEVGKRLAADLGDTQQPAKTQPAKTAAGANKHSRYAAAGDPFDTIQWRREIFLTAAKNNGLFVTEDYAKSFNASHNGVSIGNTKIYGALHYMVSTNQLTKLGAGRYRVTGAGRKAAEEMGINIAAAATPAKKTLPAKKVAAPAKKTLPAKKAAPAPAKKAAPHPATPEMLLKYAAEHDGNIFTRDFMNQHHTSPGGTYGTLATLQTEKRVEKVDKGHFRVLEQAAPEAAGATA